MEAYGAKRVLTCVPLPSHDSYWPAAATRYPRDLTLSNLAEAYQYEKSVAGAEGGISRLTLSGPVRNCAALLEILLFLVLQ